MAELPHFASRSFDLVFHPVSNCFVPDVRADGAKHFAFCGRAAVCSPGF